MQSQKLKGCTRMRVVLFNPNYIGTADVICRPQNPNFSIREKGISQVWNILLCNW